MNAIMKNKLLLVLTLSWLSAFLAPLATATTTTALPHANDLLPYEDDLNELDLRMCMDMMMLQQPQQQHSPATTESTPSFYTSQKVEQLVHSLNDMTSGRFGNYQDLPPSVRSHLWLYVKQRSIEQQQPQHQQQRSSPSSEATATSVLSSSSSLRPICLHVVHGAQFMSIPFQFIAQQHQPQHLSSFSSQANATSTNMSDGTNTTTLHHHQQKHPSWITTWQSLAPNMILEQGFQCNPLLKESAQRQGRGNVFLRQSQSQQQQSQQQLPACSFQIQVHVHDVMNHIGTFCFSCVCFPHDGSLHRHTDGDSAFS
jgi:hypothetical protein